ncbi:hypothetical protein RL72_00939 [Microbacterium azadirachtae]|uniref:Uncharacterized protein n=1 Tax=Microbacterium azadirachtae TaxID=582680 RepID=A0A0F0L0C9_9MICO|nr:hypothetical protein [Microbacterium azadirachtae]KJL26607.1 hypothetical protein RL72_00939 [Microbacterium azadirachtae]
MTAQVPTHTLPDGLEIVIDVTGRDGGTARLGIRRARAGELVDAYPAGTHDRELLVEGSPAPSAVAEFAAHVLAQDARCRRIVLPVPERDLDAIAWAEDAGFRYVVDIETRSGGWSLLVIEPDWVLAQPHVLEDIPLKE